MAVYQSKKKRVRNSAGISLIIVLLLHGCAFDVIHVRQSPCQIEKGKSNSKSFRLSKEVQVTLDTGYNRKLKDGVRWDYVGDIPPGQAFRTNGQIVTVEGSNSFEAYIVVSSGKLVGFYLPVQKAFSPMKVKGSNLRLTVAGDSEIFTSCSGC